jgi:hypothetical protein
MILLRPRAPKTTKSRPRLDSRRDGGRSIVRRLQQEMSVQAASVLCKPSFDNGSVNEILWYGTFGITEPRAPWLS